LLTSWLLLPCCPQCAPWHSKDLAAMRAEAPMEVLPRLFQVKFDDGLQEETLFIGNAQELPSAVGAPLPVPERRIRARACSACA